MDFYTLQIIKPVADTAKEQTDWLQYLSGLSTPTLAAFGIWIAWSQWNTARMKLKFELFDKRMVVYEAVRNIMGNLNNNDLSRTELELSYYEGISATKWLFNREMERFLSGHVFGEILRLRVALRQEDSNHPANSQQGLKERMAVLKDIAILSKNIEERFAPFLSLGH